MFEVILRIKAFDFSNAFIFLLVVMIVVMRWAAVAIVMGEYGVGNIAVRENLYRTVIVLLLLGCQYVRVMAVHSLVDTYYALDQARYCTQVV